MIRSSHMGLFIGFSSVVMKFKKTEVKKTWQYTVIWIDIISDTFAMKKKSNSYWPNLMNTYKIFICSIKVNTNGTGLIRRTFYCICLHKITLLLLTSLLCLKKKLWFISNISRALFANKPFAADITWIVLQNLKWILLRN